MRAGGAARRGLVARTLAPHARARALPPEKQRRIAFCAAYFGARCSACMSAVCCAGWERAFLRAARGARVGVSAVPPAGAAAAAALPRAPPGSPRPPRPSPGTQKLLECALAFPGLVGRVRCGRVSSEPRARAQRVAARGPQPLALQPRTHPVRAGDPAAAAPGPYSDGEPSRCAPAPPPLAGAAFQPRANAPACPRPFPHARPYHPAPPPSAGVSAPAAGFLRRLTLAFGRALSEALAPLTRLCRRCLLRLLAAWRRPPQLPPQRPLLPLLLRQPRRRLGPMQSTYNSPLICAASATAGSTPRRSATRRARRLHPADQPGAGLCCALARLQLAARACCWARGRGGPRARR